MPFRAGGELEEAVAEGVSTVVMLTSDAEAGKKVGRDLAEEYRARGLERIHLPIVEFSTPDATDLAPAVRAAATRVRAGKTILVHCSAGIGRTGMFLAGLLRELTGVDARAAIEHVRGFVSGAVETPEQVRVVEGFTVAPIHP
jgi:protein-tyrosine phosphatase